MIPYYLGEVAAVKSLCEQLQPYTTGGTSGEGIQAFMDQTKSVEAAAGKKSQTADSGRTNDRMVSSKPKFRPLKNNTGQLDLWHAIRRKMFLEKSIPLVHG